MAELSSLRTRSQASRFPACTVAETLPAGRKTSLHCWPELPESQGAGGPVWSA